jgi:stage III sporulation protein AA
MSSTEEVRKLLGLLPKDIESALQEHSTENLIEVVMDLGRNPEARFNCKTVLLSHLTVTPHDLEQTVSALGRFGADNRAGIESTLHRISCVRNRYGEIVGLTCRVGRALFGSAVAIKDIIESGNSILLLGAPGKGKTTALREICRVLANELSKRVVIIDTSNEIAGDGDIPHPAIGRARRMQVARPELQHQVMIEAVENHMPEVIVIDEIGNYKDANAARTIAERGVQLVATAHGNTLENLIKNPSLCNLIGGVQTVILGDAEARRRSTQKTVLERKADPCFQVAIELTEQSTWSVHLDVAAAVDKILRGEKPAPQIRSSSDGRIHILEDKNCDNLLTLPDRDTNSSFSKELLVYPYGIDVNRLVKAATAAGIAIAVSKTARGADFIITLKQYAKPHSQLVRLADKLSLPICECQGNTVSQIKKALLALALAA